MTEMVARSCKRILNFKLARATYFAGESVKDVKDGMDLISELEKTNIKDMFNDNLKKITAEILNFVFGNSEISQAFWMVNLRE